MALIVKNIIWQKRYMDSLRLMRISNKAAALEGVEKVAVVMATVLNKEILKEVGLLVTEGAGASNDDIFVAVAVEDENRIQAVLDFIEEEMKREGERIKDMAGYAPKSLESALEMMPQANLSLISVPGQYAKAEAMKALKKGLHVFLFSDNVTIEEELELKKYAEEQGLLVMGPGCGTAIINGVGLAFANVVKKGPVGIVAAAGTGLQEVSTLLSNAGVGVSHGFGTGGRDLSDKIGGITAKQCLRILEEDPETEVIVLISKPPGPNTAQELSKYLVRMRKPVVLNFIGLSSTIEGGDKVFITKTLEGAALRAVSLIRNEAFQEKVFTEEMSKVLQLAESEYKKFSGKQRYVRGLYSGGTVCSESTLILADFVPTVTSNMPPRAELEMKDTKVSVAHALVDLGDEEFTVGRAHPMIDPFVRKQRFLQEARDPETAVILLDVVLGYGSHPDMARVLADTIIEAKSLKEKEGGYLSVVASVIGTEEDPQKRSEQEKKLLDCGVVIMPSNAQAARMAALIATRGEIKNRL
ncbi:MAG: acyl-CoA synthetase FdrA [Nitrospirota bacterium]